MKKFIQKITQATKLQRLFIAATILFNAFIILLCKDEIEWCFLCLLLSLFLWLCVFMSALFGMRTVPEEDKSSTVISEIEWHEIAEMVSRQHDYQFN